MMISLFLFSLPRQILTKVLRIPFSPPSSRSFLSTGPFSSTLICWKLPTSHNKQMKKGFLLFALFPKQASFLPCTSQTSPIFSLSILTHFNFVWTLLFYQNLFSFKNKYWTLFSWSQDGIIVTSSIFPSKRYKINKPDKIIWNNSFPDPR